MRKGISHLWWYARFFWFALWQFDFEDRPVQRLMDERYATNGRKRP